MSQPLVSICITSYNQRDFILQAIDGALNQDYENLEILIADDCSTDGSVELIKNFIKNATRRIVLLTAEKNLGIAKNYERMFLVAKGDLLVCADGDDVSHPNRVSSLVEAWENNGRKATLLTSNAIEIDENGHKIGLAHTTMRGAVMAFSRDALRNFGSIIIDGAAQDHVYANRCLMIGGGQLHISKPLITYRVGVGVSSVLNNRRIPGARMAKIRINGFKQSLIDLDCVRYLIGEEKYQHLRAKYLSEIEFQQARYTMIMGSTFRERYAAWKKNFPGFRRGKALNAIYLFPSRIGDVLFAIDIKIKRLLKGSLA